MSGPSRPEVEDAAPTFVCARCGRRYAATSATNGRGKRPGGALPESMFVLLGGKPWCSRCAKARFRRRYTPSAAFGTNWIEK